MSSHLPDNSPSVHSPEQDSVSMPQATPAPLILAAGIALAAMGVAFGIAFVFVGGLLLTFGLGMWIANLLPGKGHFDEALVAIDQRPIAIAAQLDTVGKLRPGAPGYRFRLPEKVHPISAGIKGGIIGGLVMPVPALAYGFFSGHGIWYPINLLSGMVLPGLGNLDVSQLESFRLDLLLLGIAIHAVISVISGLIYGVLMPTLPSIPRTLVWGGLLMPILWTGVIYLTLGVVNPLLSWRVDWPWFIFSQFIFGVVVAIVVEWNKKRHAFLAGLLGGLFGGALMLLPALAWAWITGRSIWYPANLLAAMAYPNMRTLPSQELQEFRIEWLAAAIAIHLATTITFGLIYGLLLTRVTRIPAPLAWGGLVLPLVWTGMSYGLMGVVNPLLQSRVDWPWFVVSQFIFGVVASVVVLRSEMVHIAPAGRGPEAVPDATEECLQK